MFRKERGITLVALVVTIVVLLILAGISLSLVLGGNGLITRAKSAQATQEQAVANDTKLTEEAVNTINGLLE